MPQATDIQLGAFRLDGRIARGGMASVWAGHHLLGLPVAVKVLEGSRATRFASGLRREIAAAAGLEHPGIIRLYDFGEVPEGLPLPAGSPWLAMQRAGGTLRGHPVDDWATLRDLALTVLDALAHAHARGVIHRDLKPENLLHLPEATQPWVLADFGLARAGFGAEDSGPVVGTPAYMPPEQARGDWRAEGPATDLYALGCLIWELAYGEPPFVGTREEVLRGHLYRDPVPGRPRIAVPVDLERWLVQLLAKRPQERFQSAAHAANALHAMGDPEVAFTPMLQPRRGSARLSTVVFVDLPRASDSDEISGFGPGGHQPFPDDWRVPHALAPTPPSEAGLRLFPLRTRRLVGRERERDRLWALLREVVQDRRPRHVAVSGPPGTGARRLAGWVAERALELGLAAAVHQRRGTSLQDTLRDRLRLQGLDVDGMDRGLGELGVPDTFERQLMAQALCGGDGGWPMVQVDSVLAVLLGWLATLVPLVLVLEDPRPGVVDALVQRRVPVLVVEAGPESDAPERVPLGPLHPDEMHRLFEDALGLDPALTAEVVEQAAGNPGRAERLVLGWIQRGELSPSEAGFRLVDGASRTLPEALSDAWVRSAREWIGARPDADREALEVAAVLGHPVSPDEWEAALGQLGITPRAGLVDDLVDAGLAVRSGAADWGFAHPALADDLRAGAGARLEAIHRACAAVTPDPDRQATHLLAVEPTPELLELLVEASRVHHLQGRMDRAARRMDQWTEVVHALGIVPPDERLVLGIVQRSAVRRILGHDEAGEAEVRDALTWTTELRLRGRLLGELASILGQRGLADEALPLQKRAREIALELGDRRRWISLAQSSVLMAVDAGRYEEALARIDEVISEPAAPGHVQAQLLRLRSTACIRLGWADQAEAALDRAVPLAREAGHVRILGALANDLGMLRVVQERYDEADQAFHEAVTAYRLAGSWAEVVARLNLAMLDDLRGRHQAAHRELVHLIHQARVQKNPPMWLLIRLTLLKVEVSLGNWAAVDALLAEVEAIPRGQDQAWIGSKRDQVDQAIDRAEQVGRSALVPRLRALRESL